MIRLRELKTSQDRLASIGGGVVTAKKSVQRKPWGAKEAVSAVIIATVVLALIFAIVVEAARPGGWSAWVNQHIWNS